jgi:hypothetical protein
MASLLLVLVLDVSCDEAYYEGLCPLHCYTHLLVRYMYISCQAIVLLHEQVRQPAALPMTAAMVAAACTAA